MATAINVAFWILKLSKSWSALYRLSHPNFWVINYWSARCEYFENSKNKFLNTLLKGALGEFQVKAIFVENCRDFKDSNATNHFKIGWNCHNHSNKLSENPKSEN